MKKPLIISIAIIVILAILLITQFTFKQDKETSEQQTTMDIKSVFANNQRIPEKYTCDGKNINPPIELIEIPQNAESLVLIVDDPDAPGGTWDHWVLFNISPRIKKIEENSAPKGAIQALNSWSKNNYGGPCPPKDSGKHRYFFKLYALNKILDLDENAKKSDVEAEMEGSVINVAELIGFYSRR